MPNPTLSGVQTSVVFLENTVNATPLVLDADVSFNDVDNNFNGGTVRVTGLLAEDRITISPGGLIGVSGSNVLYNGGVIGSFAGGVVNTFTVTLNGTATSPAVEALIEHLAYGNVSDTPTGSRTLNINVFDAAGGDVQSTGTWSDVSGAGNNPFHFAGDPTASATPNGFDAGTNAVPAFIDLDKDGDRDVVAATGLGELIAYFNNGDGTYTPQTAFFNGGAGLGLGFAAPIAVDWDGDGDMDLIVGDAYGALRYFRHDAGSAFVEQPGALAGLSAAVAGIPLVTGYEQYNRVAFVLDYDGDGHLDVMMGGYDPGGTPIPMRTFLNNGAGGFTYVTGGANPFNAIITDRSSAATLIDYDRDGDQDIVLQSNTSLRYIQNNGPNNFVELTGGANPFNGVSVAQGGGGVAFFDHDGDNDQDILVGLGHGGFQYLRNNATHGQSIVVNVTAADDPPVAVADGPTVDADAATDIAVLTNDTDVDGGPKSVLEINGSAVSIGIPVSLASGATVTLNADGTITYDPAGNFDHLVSLATALATGASNFSAVDSFSYTLDGGSSATVTVTVFGVDEPGDELLGTALGNEIIGTSGNDVIRSFEDNDILAGGDGDDVLYGNDDADTLLGGADDDRLYGGNGDDILQGGEGNDVLIGNLGADTMQGGEGDDVYHVGQAGDVVTENPNAGFDTVRSQIDYTLTDNVEELFIGGAARAGTGNALDNTLHGSDSSNTLSGLAGDDILRGNGGRDVLLGGDGEDIIDGGVGRDTLTGGADRDVFQFRDGDMGATRPLADVITDFSQADNEKIHLGLVDADTGTAGDQSFTFLGTGAFSGTAGELRSQVVLGDTWISADTDGDGAADWYIGLTGVHTLTASDFVL